MTDKSSKASSHLKLTNQILKGSGTFWFVVAALGQALFFYFIVKFYYTSTLSGNFEWWDRKNIITGFVKNDTIGNYNFALHVLIAAIITLCGILQLIPYIRKNFRKLHRISGRIFIISSIIMSINGLWLVWVRHSYLNIIGAINISIVGILLIISALLTIKYAMSRKFQLHEEWAMRTFLLASAVWFQRIGYMAWIVINKGTPGIGDNMGGPFDIFLSFADYLITLSIYEAYRFAKKSKSSLAKISLALVLIICASLTAIGVFGTYAIMWHKFL